MLTTITKSLLVFFYGALIKKIKKDGLYNFRTHYYIHVYIVNAACATIEGMC